MLLMILSVIYQIDFFLHFVKGEQIHLLPVARAMEAAEKVTAVEAAAAAANHASRDRAMHNLGSGTTATATAAAESAAAAATAAAASCNCKTV